MLSHSYVLSIKSNQQVLDLEGSILNFECLSNLRSGFFGWSSGGDSSSSVNSSSFLVSFRLFGVGDNFLGENFVSFWLWGSESVSFEKNSFPLDLGFCLHLFRQALLQNYAASDLVFFEPHTKDFYLEKFAPFVHGNNILDIFTQITPSKAFMISCGRAI